MAKGAIYLEKHKDGKITTDVESIDGLIAYGIKLSQYIIDTDKKFNEDFKAIFEDLNLSDEEIMDILERMSNYLGTSLTACIDAALNNDKVLPTMLAKMQKHPKYSMHIEDVQTGEDARKRYEDFKKEGK